MRLDRYLADAGAGTRQEVKKYIKKGMVSVNGTRAKDPGEKVDEGSAVVILDGKRIEYQSFQYFMLNKPAGIITATMDKKEKTVVDLIDVEKRRDLFPVGRLDKDTEGLLLITNDGIMANRLLKPGRHVDKVYYARIAGLVTAKTVEQFEQGLDIGDETLTKPAVLTILGTKEKPSELSDYESEIEISIVEGRFHQIKRMFEAVGMQVVYLKRLSMGPLRLDENLEYGAFRVLTEDEIEILKKITDQKN